MPTLWNTVGKVKNIKLYNFRLVQLFHSLHYVAISLEVTRMCSYAPSFSRGTTNVYLLNVRNRRKAVLGIYTIV